MGTCSCMKREENPKSDVEFYKIKDISKKRRKIIKINNKFLVGKVSNDQRMRKLIIKAQSIFRGLILRKKVKTIRISKRNFLMRDESNQRFTPTKSFKIVKYYIQNIFNIS